jgi:imidazolonepropionase
LASLAGAAAKGGRRTLESDLGLLRKAAILEKGGRIVWVGPESRLPKSLVAPLGRRTAVEEIDLAGRTVLPGFVECHTHLVFSGNRADEFELRNKGAGYQEIADRGGGILATVRPTRAASLDELAHVAQVRANTFVRQGVTTLEAKSGYGLTLASEFKILKAAGLVKGPRLVRTYLGPHAIPPEAESAEFYMEAILREHLPRLKEEGHACRVDIFVEIGYFSEKLARRYLQRARELGFDLVVHADQLTRSGGARLAVEFAARSAEHLIQIDNDDVCSLAASDVTCVLLPAADLYLKCPYPPARSLIDQGARVAIATDFNPGSSPTQSLSLVGVLSRLEMKMTLPETIAAYTVGAAHALGLGRELGSIEEGKLCDIVTLDCGWGDLFYSVGEMSAHQSWREGRPLLRSPLRTN